MLRTRFLVEKRPIVGPLMNIVGSLMRLIVLLGREQEGESTSHTNTYMNISLENLRSAPEGMLEGTELRRASWGEIGIKDELEVARGLTQVSVCEQERAHISTYVNWGAQEGF